MEGKGIGTDSSASSEDVAECYGLETAIRNVLTNKGKKEKKITLASILKMHRTVFGNTKSFAGEFRKLGEEVGVYSAGIMVHRGADSGKVIALLKEAINEYHKPQIIDRSFGAEAKMYLAKAVRFHCQFENIHPFRDGNGRVGRLLFEKMLIDNDLDPINIILETRHDYYKALQSYEHEGSIRAFVEYLKKQPKYSIR